MKISALIAVILVYMVMASQFESLVQPFFILFTIPFALVGVVWFLLLTGTYFTVDSFLGVIMLIGIVVNNAIVLISYINLLRDRGMDVKEAVLVGSKRRLRPILLTSLTTIFGLLPLSFQAGEGSEYWRPFSNAIIGGLSISFVITLFIIPLIYYLYERKSISRD
jgi:HAE1 family hydrophobic/amphiphilic exporter-1